MTYEDLTLKHISAKCKKESLATIMYDLIKLKKDNKSNNVEINKSIKENKQLLINAIQEERLYEMELNEYGMIFVATAKKTLPRDLYNAIREIAHVEYSSKHAD